MRVVELEDDEIEEDGKYLSVATSCKGDSCVVGHVEYYINRCDIISVSNSQIPEKYWSVCNGYGDMNYNPELILLLLIVRINRGHLEG